MTDDTKPNKPNKPNNPITLRLTPEVIATIKSIAKSSGVSGHAITRMAVEKGLPQVKEALS